MRLSVNIDHIATIRNARGGDVPNPVEAARICEAAGAVGIVCHLREDRRHMKDNDIRALRKSITTKLDLEMAPTEEIIGIALQTKPELVTLVPERRQELTTEGGLDVLARKKYLSGVLQQFRKASIPVSLFIAPDERQIRAAAEIGTDMIELHTGEYADALQEEEIQEHLQRIRESAKLGKSLGLGVNSGHGLGYENIKPVAAIPEIEEVSIGYAVIVRALFVGLDQAVREMIQLVK
jgi:pyridoxine 5-phosphate synthase